jgi:hypothetical protein
MFATIFLLALIGGCRAQKHDPKGDGVPPGPSSRPRGDLGMRVRLMIRAPALVGVLAAGYWTAKEPWRERQRRCSAHKGGKIGFDRVP